MFPPVQVFVEERRLVPLVIVVQVGEVPGPPEVRAWPEVPTPLVRVTALEITRLPFIFVEDEAVKLVVNVPVPAVNP